MTYSLTHSQLSFVLLQITRLTDRQTDGRTDRRTALSWLYRALNASCNVACSAIKRHQMLILMCWYYTCENFFWPAVREFHIQSCYLCLFVTRLLIVFIYMCSRLITNSLIHSGIDRTCSTNPAICLLTGLPLFRCFLFDYTKADWAGSLPTSNLYHCLS